MSKVLVCTVGYGGPVTQPLQRASATPLRCGSSWRSRRPRFIGGYGSTLTGGNGSTLTGGDGSTLAIMWWCEKRLCYRTLFAEIESEPDAGDGLKARVKYRVAVDGGQARFVEVEP